MTVIKIPGPPKVPAGMRADITEDAAGALAVAGYKFTILHEGKVLPVTNMFGMDGREVSNPMHAFRCVVFDKDGPEGKWVAITCTPGELALRRI